MRHFAHLTVLKAALPKLRTGASVTLISAASACGEDATF